MKFLPLLLSSLLTAANPGVEMGKSAHRPPSLSHPELTGARALSGAKMRWTGTPPHFLGSGVPVPGKRHAHPGHEMSRDFHALFSPLGYGRKLFALGDTRAFWSHFVEAGTGRLPALGY